MSDLIWLSEAQMRQIEPHFPLSHGVAEAILLAAAKCLGGTHPQPSRRGPRIMPGA